MKNILLWLGFVLLAVVVVLGLDAVTDSDDAPKRSSHPPMPSAPAEPPLPTFKVQ